MKKVFSVLLVVLAILLFPITALAVDFSIENMNIDVELQENGDAFVTEEQTYNFDGKFKGLSRTLIPKKGTRISNVEAHENSEALEVEQDGNIYKVHRKGKDEIVTIEITYEIEDGVTVYSDVAEFYWPFFDTENETGYDAFEVTIHPPQSTDDVIAFGYNAAEESAEIKGSGDVHFDLGNVSSGEGGDIRVAYDNALFPGATITEDTSMREEIVAEEQRLINERIEFEKRQNSLASIAPYILVILASVFIGLLLLARQKKQAVLSEVERKFTTPYFVPERFMSLPATIFFMKHGIVQPEVLSAALMDLVRKGNVEETDEGTFKVVNRNTTYQHETFLIDWLFDKIGNNETFRTEDLDTYIDDEKNQETYQMDYAEWQKAVQEEKKSYDLFSKNIKARLIVLIGGLLIIPFTVFLGIYELYLMMIIGIILVIGYFAFAISFRTYTVTGARINRDWQFFQDQYSQMDADEWDELNTDDQKRAFIYGVGIKDKEIEKTNELLLNRYPSESYSATNPMYFLAFSSIATGSFSQAQETSSASAPGGSAGGGTGVGGGGGGSGAF